MRKLFLLMLLALPVMLFAQTPKRTLVVDEVRMDGQIVSKIDTGALTDGVNAIATSQAIKAALAANKAKGLPGQIAFGDSDSTLTSSSQLRFNGAGIYTNAIANSWQRRHIHFDRSFLDTTVNVGMFSSAFPMNNTSYLNLEQAGLQAASMSWLPNGSVAIGKFHASYGQGSTNKFQTAALMVNIPGVQNPGLDTLENILELSTGRDLGSNPNSVFITRMSVDKNGNLFTSGGLTANNYTWNTDQDTAGKSGWKMGLSSLTGQLELLNPGFSDTTVFYVKQGADTINMNGSLEFPFPTPWHALASAPDTALIIVFPGTYTSCTSGDCDYVSPGQYQSSLLQANKSVLTIGEVNIVANAHIPFKTFDSGSPQVKGENLNISGSFSYFSNFEAGKISKPEIKLKSVTGNNYQLFYSYAGGGVKAEIDEVSGESITIAQLQGYPDGSADEMIWDIKIGRINDTTIINQGFRFFPTSSLNVPARYNFEIDYINCDVNLEGGVDALLQIQNIPNAEVTLKGINWNLNGFDSLDYFSRGSTAQVNIEIDSFNVDNSIRFLRENSSSKTIFTNTIFSIPANDTIIFDKTGTTIFDNSTVVGAISNTAGHTINYYKSIVNGEFVTDLGCIIKGTIWLNTSKTIGVFHGTGTPEGSVAAGVGSTFHRADGGAGTSYYVKESGTGTSGWVAK